MTTMNEPSLLTFGRQPAVDRNAHLTIGAFVFPGQDQIDFTGPFEVLSRIPESTFVVLGKTLEPIRDVKGLLLTPVKTIAEAPRLDLLRVPGGLGQQQIMNDEEIIGLIQRQAASGRYVFSVCTGALLCGVAGLLRGRHATTHWAAKELLPLYGAIPTDARVVIDGNYVSSAGVTAGLDGALEIAALLRGQEVAEEIQLEIEYAPNPNFTAVRRRQPQSQWSMSFTDSTAIIGRIAKRKQNDLRSNWASHCKCSADVCSAGSRGLWCRGKLISEKTKYSAEIMAECRDQPKLTLTSREPSMADQSRFWAFHPSAPWT
jgi:cyclohexyl-isocyanide hydratase